MGIYRDTLEKIAAGYQTPAVPQYRAPNMRQTTMANMPRMQAMGGRPMYTAGGIYGSQTRSPLFTGQRPARTGYTQNRPQAYQPTWGERFAGMMSRGLSWFPRRRY